MHRLDCHSQIKQVLHNYNTAYSTVRTMIAMASHHPEVMHQYDMSIHAMKSVEQELHDVYLARMFACFENILRNYWRKKVRDTQPATKVLISSIATRRGVTQDTQDGVHGIRKYRNYLIHDESEDAQPYEIEDASRHLNAFLARLPADW